MTHLIIPYCVSNPHSLHLQKQLFFSREYRSLAKGFLSALSFIEHFLSVYAWCCHALGIQGSGSVEFVWGGRQWRSLVTERCEGWTGLGERHSEEELSSLRSGRGGAEGDAVWAELGPGAHREQKCCDPIRDWIGAPARGEDAQSVGLQGIRGGAAGPRSPELGAACALLPRKPSFCCNISQRAVCWELAGQVADTGKGPQTFCFQYSLVCVR